MNLRVKAWLGVLILTCSCGGAVVPGAADGGTPDPGGGGSGGGAIATGSGGAIDPGSGGSSIGAGGSSIGAGGSSIGSGGASGGRNPFGNPCPLVPPRDPGMLAGNCSLLGRWNVNGSHGSVQSMGIIEFDADGTYYGGPLAIDLSQTYAYDGAYTVSGSTFNLLFSCGDGCNGSGTFGVEFQSNCSLAVLNESITECTGNRKVVAGKVVLTRQ